VRNVTSTDGTGIVFETSGEGPLLVIVAGAFCDRNSKKSLAEGLQSSFTVCEYDRRGRGDSRETGPYAIEREVEDLAAIVDAVGPSFVFGDSSGGALAIEASAAGVPIDKLAVYEVPYVFGASYVLADELTELVTSGRRAEAVERFLVLMGTPPSALQAMRQGPQWGYLESFAHTLPYDVRLCNNGSVPTDRLAKITVPLLALAGDAGPWAREVAVAIAAATPEGQDRVLVDQGHAVPDDVLIPILREFFVA
jgi:pimeloyl-ACP methyl ester carboxylesterase